VQQLTENVHAAAAAQGRRVVVIAESAANDPRTIRTVDAGGQGFDAQWSDDFHHALHALLTGERDGYYEDFGALLDLARAYERGFSYDGRYSSFRGCTHGAPTGGLPGERFVVFAQNHDQIGNRMHGDRLSALVGAEALRLAAAAVLLAPFVPLLFMGEEVGATTPFPYFVSHGDTELVEAVRQGRAREFAAFQGDGGPPDPQAESTFTSAILSDATMQDGAVQRDWCRLLLTLRRTHPALATLDRDATTVSVDEPARSLVVSRGRGSELVAVLHFDDATVSVNLPAPGPWGVLAESSFVEVGDDRVRVGPWGVVVLERLVPTSVAS
jgi:maltooligosyltrehalose trehalohydrolase